MPQISVIIPVYNKVKYLESLYCNLKSQSFQNYECIIINDGSTDGSKEKLEALFSADKRYRIIHVKNAGVSNARNIGLNNANCKYVTFIDADDTMHFDYLKNLYKCICDTNADLVISSYKKVWEDSDTFTLSIVPIKGLFSIEQIMPKFAMIQKDTGIFGFCWGKILKKDFCNDVYFDTDLKLAEDFDFYLKIYDKIDTIYFDDKCYYNYLQNASNSSSSAKDNEINYFSQILINLRYRNFLITKNQFTGQNKKIVEQLLSNYVFFTIFHCNLANLKDKFKSIFEIINSEKIKLKPTNNFQKWIFYLIKKNYFILTKFTFKFYRFVKKIIRRS